jgi:hypothetical protein
MSHGGTTLNARVSGFLYRSNPKGMISLPAIRAREMESFGATGDGML